MSRVAQNGYLTRSVEEEDTAVILYTSGTTGHPKGAMLTHLGICHSAMHYQCCMGLSRDRSIVAVPMSHVTGVVALIAAMVRAAGTLIVMPSFRAAEFLELSERWREGLLGQLQSRCDPRGIGFHSDTVPQLRCLCGNRQASSKVCVVHQDLCA
jgi:acyl-CoA synthetase (AMP-forming)/AMP-acid ligase II